MEDLTAYHDRLIGLVQGEIDRLGCSRAEMAEHLELSPTALYKWLNRKIEGELSSGAIAALAEYFKCDRGALQEYLRIGKWPEIKNSPTMDDRVGELEATVKRLSAQLESLSILENDWSMPNLARAMQDAVTNMGLDWRDDSTLRQMYETFTRPKEEGGMGYRTPSKMPLRRLRQILFGISEAIEGEDPIIAHMMCKYTGDQSWTLDYVRGLSEGSIHYQSELNQNGTDMTKSANQ